MKMSSKLGDELINSVESGDFDAVRDLVLKQNAPVNHMTEGWTPLIKAAYKGHIEIVRFLIENCGADPNRQSGDKWTPLFGAVSADGNRLEIVQYLLDHGANPLITTRGKTPEMLANEKGKRDIVLLLNDNLKWQKLGEHRIQNYILEPLFEVTRIFNFKSMNVMTVVQDREHKNLSHSEMHFSNPAVDLDLLAEAKKELLERGGSLDERAVDDALKDPMHGRRMRSLSRRKVQHGG